MLIKRARAPTGTMTPIRTFSYRGIPVDLGDWEVAVERDVDGREPASCEHASPDLFTNGGGGTYLQCFQRLQWWYRCWWMLEGCLVQRMLQKLLELKRLRR